jgi:cytochrome P450
VPSPDLDLKAPANVSDPFPLYAWLRDRDPVHRSASLDAWVVTRYADVVALFEQPARFSSDRFRKAGERYVSERDAVQAVATVLRDWLVFRDPPDHTRLRALLQKTFTPRQLERSTPRIQATIDALLAPIAERGETDFVRDFAFPLPARVIAFLLGAADEQIEPIKRASDRLAAYLGGNTEGRDNFAEASAGVAQLVEIFQRLLAERRARPRDDLMSLMLAAEHEGGRLDEGEVIANCVLLLFAGHETTTNLLGNGLYHLLQRPEQLARLRAQPALVPSAVEELLRFDGPVPATLKIATEDVVWHGAAIRPGDRVLPMIASANRDERQFPSPDSLDVARAPNRHLAFAYGIHFCLGAPLARLEAKLALETLLRRFAHIELVQKDPPWKKQIFLRGLASLPLRVCA